MASVLTKAVKGHLFQLERSYACTSMKKANALTALLISSPILIKKLSTNKHGYDIPNLIFSQHLGTVEQLNLPRNVPGMSTPCQ